MVRIPAWTRNKWVWLCGGTVVVAACAAPRFFPTPVQYVEYGIEISDAELRPAGDLLQLQPVPPDCVAIAYDPQANAPRTTSVRLPVVPQQAGLAETPQSVPGLRVASNTPRNTAPRNNSAGQLLIDRIGPEAIHHPTMQPPVAPTRTAPPQAPPPSEPIPLTQPLPRPLAPVAQSTTPAGMQAVRERAVSIARNGERLAERNAFYSARAEFIQSLRVLTQALDAMNGETRHSQALADGLKAMTEADDFAPTGSKLEADLDLGSIVQRHRTPVLKDADIASLTPLVCLQRYYGFARQRLVSACEGEPAASPALYGLGRLTAAMAERSPDDRRLHSPKAMALYQAALTLDGNHAQAAHELGVLYAQFGQFEEAQRLLVRAATVAPRVATWHNLAVVHERLGQRDLAEKARYEMQLLARRSGAPTTAVSSTKVQWVDVSKFADKPPAAAAPPVRAALNPKTSGGNPWLR